MEEKLMDSQELNTGATTKLIPLCGLMHPEDSTEFRGEIDGIQLSCTDFIPSISNDGLCVTRNSFKMEEIFTHNSHLSKFTAAFVSGNSSSKVENISKKQSEYHFTLIVDRNRYNNLKRGRIWNETTNEKIKIGIHSPDEVADIRGWYNKIINLAPGHITTIKVKPGQQQSEYAIKDLPIKERKCRFEDEADDLSSLKTYTKVHCLFDCKMKLAEEICGCRPWDYPDSNRETAPHHGTKGRICDLFGNSCFDQILRHYSSTACDEKCVPSCSKVSYSIDISKDALDPENKICRIHLSSLTNMESIIRDYIFTLLQRNDDFLMGKHFEASPDAMMLNKLKFILTRDNTTNDEIKDTNMDLEMDCRRKLKNDIAIVVVSIDSPTFSRTTKGQKATTLDKLAYIGKINDNLTRVC